KSCRSPPSDHSAQTYGNRGFSRSQDLPPTRYPRSKITPRALFCGIHLANSERPFRSFRRFENSRNVEVPITNTIVSNEHEHVFFQATTHKSAHAQPDREQLLLREPTPSPL